MTAGCAHCGGPVPATVPASLTAFCCAGCAAAHRLIGALGLDAYYGRRSLDPALRPPRPDGLGAADPAPYVRRGGDGTCRLNLMVDGLQCAACVWLIESVMGREAGHVEARVNLTTRRLALAWRGAADDAGRLVQRIADLGYRVVPFDPVRLERAEAQASARLLRAMAVAGFAAANVMLLSVAVWSGQATTMGEATRDLLHWFQALVALPAIGYASRPFLSSAWTAFRHGRTNMDVPISIGVALTAGMSLFETIRGGEHVFFDSAVTLLFFLLIGRTLDARARGKARAAAGHLLALRARAVTRLDAAGRPHAATPDTVVVGDRVLVAAGERLPVDGVVEEGRSTLDVSLVTGESTPAATRPGDRVFAGTLNVDGPLTLRVGAVGADTLLADIARMMEAAERGRARHVALADRVTRWYTPVVHGLALATFLGWAFGVGVPWQAALLNAVAVLIITCPCALALAVPVVQVVAAGRLFRAGVLVKSPTALERLAEADTVVLDKTGTLTLGRPELDPATPDDEALVAATAIAAVSRHPLAQALARAVPGARPAPEAREVPGEGLIVAAPGGEARLGRAAFCGAADHEGSDRPELWFSRPGQEPRRFRFRDRVREDAAATIARLGAMGLAVELVSGDRAGPVAAAARAAGIATWRANARPADKVDHLAALARRGRRVAMIGDGLNDAPALAAAHVSLSPASAADISQNAADAVFQGDRLAPVATTIAVARRAAALVRQNLALALAYNALAVPLAVAGLVTPIVAAAAMSASSLAVIVNALRLSRARTP